MAAYFSTPNLTDGTHWINITVTTANETNPFTIDSFAVASLAGEISHVDVDAIAGGVVGGIAGIGVLAIAVWYFLRSRGGAAEGQYTVC